MIKIKNTHLNNEFRNDKMFYLLDGFQNEPHVHFSLFGKRETVVL